MATLHHQVWIDAPREKVYEALASAEGLAQWWAPHTASETDEGLVLAHSPGPAHGNVQMKVLERTPHRRIEWKIISSHPASSPASAWSGTHIVFELTTQPSPGHWLGMNNEGQPMTVLEFHQVGWDEDSEFLGFCNYAWGLTLDMLRQWCESQD
ncbi:SRPBCC family protein [Halomonas sp. A29]|uniref:SRPBCC family protein n=1 Tax=Halomonas sp. A29 TaxID=3102786 RepID=UPI00398B524C